MATAATVQGVREVIDRITSDPVEKLVTNADWGKINFQQAQNSLEMIFSVCTQLKDLPIEVMPETDLAQLKSPLDAIESQIKAMRSFTIEQTNATGVRDGIVNNLQSYADQCYAQGQLRMPFLALQRGDIRRNEAALSKSVKEAGVLLAGAQADILKKQDEIDTIVSAAREAAASVGVAHFSGQFEKTAVGLDENAKTWMTVTAVFASATLIAAAAIPMALPMSDTPVLTPHDVQIFTSKLVVLGILFAATVWCGRLYKAAKHQAAMNRHRGDALKTFQAFVKASGDEQTRNAVLLETTRSIFSVTRTGYLDGAESSGDGPIKIIEIVKSAVDTATKP